MARDAANENLYKELTENGPKMIHRLAKTRQRRSKDIDRLSFVKDRNGNILSEDSEVKERWRNYFNTLLNTENTGEELATVSSTEGPIQDLETTEVEYQLERMKNNKYTGPDELPINLINLLRERGTTG
jgi:hypothetical protein